MRVLVTGGAGFLGRWFIVQHLANGDEVVAVDDLSNPHSHWPDELPSDGRDEDDLLYWLTQNRTAMFDLAYHFAADVGGRLVIDGDPLRNLDSLALDVRFFSWAASRVGTVVYPSSSAVYPANLQGAGYAVALRERMFRADSDTWGAPESGYGFTKLAGEVLAWKAAGYGLDTLCIRPFSGYGEDQPLDYPIPAIAQRVAERQNPLVIWGSGQQARDFIHVSDLVAATIQRLGEGVHGYQVMNIGSGVPTTFRRVAEELCRIEGYEPEIATDDEKPEGVSRRWANVEQMQRYWEPRVSLQQGLKRVLMYRKAMSVRA